MATVNLRGYDLDVVYVDVDLGSGANDGSTPSDALQTFPDPNTLVADSLYLIRRTDTNINVTKSTTTAARCHVMGMPISGASYYEGLPSEAKLAWDGDVASGVTMVGNANTTSWGWTGGSNGVYNLDLVADNGVDLFSGFFNVNSDNFTIVDSTIRVDGIPLSANPGDGLYTGTNIRCIAFESGSANGVNIEGCIFQPLNGYGLYFNSDNELNNITISNCEFYPCSTSTATCYGTYFSGTVRNSVFEDLDFYHRLSNSTSSFLFYSLYISSNAYSCDFRRLKIVSDVFNTAGGGKNGIYAPGQQSRFEDIDITIRGTQSINGLSINNQDKARVNNLIVSFPDVTTTINQNVIGLHMQSTSFVTVEDVDIQINPSVDHSGICIYGNSSTGSCVTNAVLRSGGNAINSTGMSYYNCYTTGSIVGNNTFIHIIEAQNEACQDVPFMQNSNDYGLLYVESLQLSGSSLTNPEIETSSIAIIEEVPNASLTFDPNGDFGRIYVNSEFIENLWHHETQYNTMFSTSAQRVSGGGISAPEDQPGYSIKCTGLADSNGIKQRACTIAPKPFNGIPLIFSGTGTKTVTLYYAARLETGASNKIWFELEIPDSESGTGLSQVSSFGNVHETDTSVWEGDDNLVLYKVSLTFNLLRDEPAYGRIYYDALTSIGYFYIDPVLVTEDL